MSTRFNSQALDILCPMHLVVSATGEVLHAGPTLNKIKPEMTGTRFLDVFEVKRPRALNTIEDLACAAGQKLQVRFRQAPFTPLKGVLVRANPATGEMIVNLSFGISIVDGVREFALTNADFAATDLTIEMLYLIEAKSAAMEASYRLTTRLQGAKVEAEAQAFTDMLTGLKNRRAVDAVLDNLGKGDGPFAIMLVDLDYFKAVNDTFGHAAGDFVLQNVARIMKKETRTNDTVARVGGDEFTIVMPDVYDQNTLARIGKRLIEQLEQPMHFQGNDCRISASIGTVWAESGRAQNIEEMLADADLALYASKAAGRATQTFYTPTLRDPDALVSTPHDAGQGRLQ